MYGHKKRVNILLGASKGKKKVMELPREKRGEVVAVRICEDFVCKKWSLRIARWWWYLLLCNSWCFDRILYSVFLKKDRRERSGDFELKRLNQSD